MATTIKQTEAIPDNYPTVTPFNRAGFMEGDSPPNNDQVWQRIESYTAYRWTVREVIWIVEGSGEWEPPLAPATITGIELWQSNAWAAVTLEPSPLGGICLPGDGPYRFTADVGGGVVPAAVSEAWKRLHEYTRGINDSFKTESAFISDEGGEMVRNWTGKAIQLSGAADLLRPYRRV